MSEPPSTVALMFQLIDEIKRGHGRVISRSTGPRLEGEPEGVGWLVLTAAAQATQPPTVPQIGRSLGYPRQTIQRQAELLEGRGLVQFVDNPDHKRARRIVATPSGKALQKKAAARSAKWAEDFASDLDPQRLSDAIATLRLIRERMESQARTARTKSGPAKRRAD